MTNLEASPHDDDQQRVEPDFLDGVEPQDEVKEENKSCNLGSGGCLSCQ